MPFEDTQHYTLSDLANAQIINLKLKNPTAGITTSNFTSYMDKKQSKDVWPVDDPNYDLYLLACEVTAKRFFPNFVNLPGSQQVINT